MEKILNSLNKNIEESMSIKIKNIPKKVPNFIEEIRRAPKREAKLSDSDIKLALKNLVLF